MKRFFCTICRRVKRVRNYPPSVNTSSAINPTDRIGECSYHSRPRTRVIFSENMTWKPANNAQSDARLNTPRKTRKTGTR